MALFLLLIIVAIGPGIAGAVIKGLLYITFARRWAMYGAKGEPSPCHECAGGGLLIIGVVVVIVGLVPLGAWLSRRGRSPGG